MSRQPASGPFLRPCAAVGCFGGTSTMASHRICRSKLARAIAKVCLFEPLENRQLLTTLNGGDAFDYKDVKNDLFRITVRGNTQAEFVGADVDGNTNAVTLGDLAPWDAPDGSGTDLFA